MDVQVSLLMLMLATISSASLPSSAIVNDVRMRRSFDVPIIGSLFASKPVPAIPHLGIYPLWKVHRYHGISLQPIPIPGENIPPPLPAVLGEPPSVVNVPDPNYAPQETVVPPANEYEATVHSAPGPYPPPSPPSAPYPPVYNSQLPSRAPRGPTTPNGEASSMELNSPSNSNQGFDVSSTPVAGGSDTIPALQGVLPEELATRVQQYLSTTGGLSHISSVLGIAKNAGKLKSSAVISLQGVLQKLFGGAGGSANVALQSGTYLNIPKAYPVSKGIFNGFRLIGTGISGSSIPNLPEVPTLPAVPGLQTLPPTPGLPHINLPAFSQGSTMATGGNYVSINLPQVQPLGIAEENPQAYGLPAETYGVPNQPSKTDDVPPQAYTIPARTYGEPTQTYGTPTQTYGTPAQTYGTPAQTYGTPAQTYGTPAQMYGAPTQMYGAPTQTYGAPVQTYGSPEIQSTSYGFPAGPVYQPSFESSGGDTSSFFQAPQQTYEVPSDGSSASSEKEERFIAIDKPSVKTTKLERVQDHNLFHNEDLRMYLDADHPSRYQDIQHTRKDSQFGNEITNSEEH